MTAAQHVALALCIGVGLTALAGITYMLATEHLRDVYRRVNVEWEPRPLRDADWLEQRIARESAEWQAWADRQTAENLAAEVEWRDICQVVGLDTSDTAQRIRALMALNDRRHCEAIERAERARGWSA